MQPRQKNYKAQAILYSMVMLFCVWAGMFGSLAAKPGYILYTWYQELERVYLPLLEENLYGFKNPVWWTAYLNQYSGIGAVIGFTTGLLAVLLMCSQRNYIAGKEFGTARYANPLTVTKELADKSKKYLHKEILYVRHWYSFWKESKYTFEINMMNRRLSENVWMSMDGRKTELNNNITIVGGSGAGKTFRFARNLLRQMFGSYVCTDPKGSLIKKEGKYLKDRGYRVIELNLLSPKGMRKSARFNPLCYIRHDIDVVKLVTNIMANTKPKEGAPQDPFFDEAAGVLLQALIFYTVTVYENDKKHMNFRTIMELLKKADFEIDPETMSKKESELDILFNNLEKKEEQRIRQERLSGKIPKPMSQAVVKYNSVMRAAADTVRSIVITLDTRLSTLHTEELLDLLSEDEIHIPELGMGVNFDKKTKTALFLSIPDSDDSFNFVVGMLYTLMIQQLEYYADEICDGELPISVTKLYDEFANVVMPANFNKVVSTERSRNMSSIIILQNMSQIKALYEKTWEDIVGNCDTFIYLGGNEQSTHEYISKLLGKGTYDKRTSGETLGMHGSASRNYDVVGRELMLPEEVRKMSNRKCLIFIRGYDPVFDYKIRTENHPLFKYIKKDNFIFERKNAKEGGMRFVTKECVEVFEKLSEEEETQKIITIDADALMNLPSEAIDAYAESGWYTEFEEDMIVYAPDNDRFVDDVIYTDEAVSQMDAEEAEAVLWFRAEGYSDMQTKCLLEIVTNGKKKEELKKLYPPTLDIERMELLTAPFKKKPEQKTELQKKDGNKEREE